MKAKNAAEEQWRKELINEPGSIGEEQLPADAGEKTDKAQWNLSANKTKRNHSEHRQEFWKLGAGL